MKEELFDEIRRISFQEIKNGRIKLQKIVDKPDGEKLFFSHLACTDIQSSKYTPPQAEEILFRKIVPIPSTLRGAA